MKKILKKYILPILINTCISTIVVALVFFLMNGIPLLGTPKAEDVLYMEISDRRLNIDARKFTEAEDIEKAVNITHLLKYKLGSPNQQEPIIQIKFYIKDRTTVTVRANENTVYFNAKAYAIKGDNGKLFVNITEDLLF